MADILLAYWSGTGNTEMIAEKIKEGMLSAGVEVDMRKIDEIDPSEISNFDKICFGSPSMGDDHLEEDEFEPFFNSVLPLLNGKKVALFGSYGWGDGQWMDYWVKVVNQTEAVLFDEQLIINLSPSTEEDLTCMAFGASFAIF